MGAPICKKSVIIIFASLSYLKKNDDFWDKK